MKSNFKQTTWLYFHVVVFLARFASPRRISNSSCGSMATFYRIGTPNQTALQVTPLLQKIVASLEQCIDSCVQVELCKAFNFRCERKKKCDCHLLEFDHMTNPNDVRNMIGWNLYDTGSYTLSREVGFRCRSMSKNPCFSDCTCVDTCDSFRCDCNATTKTYSSCQEALQRDPTSKYHMILHANMSNAILVQCITIGNNIWASIGHDSEAKTFVKGYASKAAYSRQIIYSADSYAAIASFVDTSTSCKQHIRIDCRDMCFFKYGFGHLRDRIGTILNYIGGGSPVIGGCACGATNACANSDFTCNCDANDGVDRFDEGYFTDKSVLPITEIRMGDTEEVGEYGYHTLGKLYCLE
eukprot:gene3378-3867_t